MEGSGSTHPPPPSASEVVRLNRAEAWEYWPAVLLAVVGACGVAATLFLSLPCMKPTTFNGVPACTFLLTQGQSTGMLVAFALPMAVGLYAVYVNRRESYVHVCANCGNVYRDRSLVSERRALARPVCSEACATAIESSFRLATVLGQVPELERAAIRREDPVTATKARERLRDLADRGPPSVRASAVEALQRLGDR